MFSTPIRLRFLIGLSAVLGGWILTSCGPQSPLLVDVSSIKIVLPVQRFEQDLFSLDSSKMQVGIDHLAKTYPEFYPLFTSRVASLGEAGSAEGNANIKRFIANGDLEKLKKDCDSVYPNLTSFYPELVEAFRHIRYYYPHQPLPRVITYLSGFNTAVINTDSTLGIGLDMFLGSRYPIYRAVQFPKYLTRTLTASYIPVTAIRGYTKQLFEEKKGTPRLIDQLIYEGKIHYFLDAIFPTMSDSMKIGYTGKQLGWCKAHESEIWSNFLQNDRLFKGEKADLDMYFAEGPFTSGLGPGSAPRLGEWTGWQIVRKYMQEKTGTTLVQLMANTESDEILRQSHYRP